MTKESRLSARSSEREREVLWRVIRKDGVVWVEEWRLDTRAKVRCFHLGVSADSLVTRFIARLDSGLSARLSARVGA